jgi:protein TonB
MVPVNEPGFAVREREVKQPPETKPVETNLSPEKIAKTDKPSVGASSGQVVANSTTEVVPGPTASNAVKDSSPLEIGSLIGYATRQAQPIYPTAAKSVRATGVVKVEVTVDENGEVSDVSKASGPALLQSAAKDAIRKWRFKPFLRDGQPVSATGFVNFNFAL